MKHLRISFVLATALFAANLPAQQAKQQQNLIPYYHNHFNFGFYLGINYANFIITPVNNWQHIAGDSLKTILSAPQVGFNLGIVSEMRMMEYMTLRFTPDLAFGERVLTYHFEGVNDFDISKKVESTFLDFPLDVKIRSKRLNNFAAYMDFGGKYVIDLASQKDVNNNTASPAQQVVKLQKNDFGIEAGAGVDFFLPYFKFGLDLKYSLGTRNLLIKDSSIYSQVLDNLRSKVFLICLTFEG